LQIRKYVPLSQRPALRLDNKWTTRLAEMSLHAEAATTASRPRNCRARSTNDPRRRIRDVDGRSEVGRRRRDLVEAFLAAIGGRASDIHMVDVTRAAELTAITEEARRRALRGENIDLAALARLEGTADRAVRRLNLKPDRVEYVPLRNRIARMAT
jgi:hypothetical protein